MATTVSRSATAPASSSNSSASSTTAALDASAGGGGGGGTLTGGGGGSFSASSSSGGGAGISTVSSSTASAISMSTANNGGGGSSASNANSRSTGSNGDGSTGIISSLDSNNSGASDASIASSSSTTAFASLGNPLSSQTSLLDPTTSVRTSPPPASGATFTVSSASPSAKNPATSTNSGSEFFPSSESTAPINRAVLLGVGATAVFLILFVVALVLLLRHYRRRGTKLFSRNSKLLDSDSVSNSPTTASGRIGPFFTTRPPREHGAESDDHRPGTHLPEMNDAVIALATSLHPTTRSPLYGYSVIPKGPSAGDGRPRMEAISAVVSRTLLAHSPADSANNHNSISVPAVSNEHADPPTSHYQQERKLGTKMFVEQTVEELTSQFGPTASDHAVSEAQKGGDCHLGTVPSNINHSRTNLVTGSDTGAAPGGSVVSSVVDRLSSDTCSAEVALHTILKSGDYDRDTVLSSPSEGSNVIASAADHSPAVFHRDEATSRGKAWRDTSSRVTLMSSLRESMESGWPSIETSDGRKKWRKHESIYSDDEA
ncbi:hypothetical protein DFJ73DRAFT_583717 [Zopfochytrium polystomum]|nr:hypothetical protein DFJ73DRAFT_583717 [Zopfochytrium polystomum]